MQNLEVFSAPRSFKYPRIVISLSIEAAAKKPFLEAVGWEYCATNAIRLFRRSVDIVLLSAFQSPSFIPMESFNDIAFVGYSPALLGVVLVLLGYRFRSTLMALGEFMRKPLLKHLSYQPIVHSQRFRLQWSRASFLAEIAYVGLNVFWVYFRSPSVVAAGRRAANMCLGNLIFLCITPHLDALTNSLGLRWRTVNRIHGSVGIMTAMLLVFHIVASFAFSHDTFPMANAENRWAVIVSWL